MSKEKSVIDYYYSCNRLKDDIRTGWKNWNVQRERVESIAEHIFGVQMLALAMKSEYHYDIDIEKVIKMLAIHELGEIIIGDLTQFQISREEKEKIEHEAVHKILRSLHDGNEIEALFLEFDAHKTKEAMFAYQCDKLECDLQCKIYDEENCVDLNQRKKDTFVDNAQLKLLQNGSSWSDMWLSFDQKNIPFDENFMSVSEYARTHSITTKDEKAIQNIVDHLQLEYLKKRGQDAQQTIFHLERKMAKLTLDNQVGAYAHNLDEMCSIIQEMQETKDSEKMILLKQELILLEEKNKKMESNEKIQKYLSLRDNYSYLLSQNYKYYKAMQTDFCEALKKIDTPDIYVYQGEGQLSKHIITGEETSEEAQIYPFYNLHSKRDFRHFYNQVHFRYLNSLLESKSFDLEDNHLGKVKIK